MTDQYLDGLETPREQRRDVSSAVDRDQLFAPTRIVLGQEALGRGDDYRPAPGWPSLAHLDYVQKFSTVTLIALALVALIVFGVINPARTARAVANVAKRRAGVE
jgi:hypothetical protein